MMRAIILCLFIALSSIPAISATTYFPPLKPLNGNDELTPESIQNYSSNSSMAPDTFSKSDYSYPKISKIERSLYGRNFANQDISQRLSRIEKSVFKKTYTDTTLSQRVENIILNFNQINEYPGISQNSLTNIESKILNRSYPNTNTLSRIERLEQELFGAVQSGDTTLRYQNLRTAASKYKTNPLAYFPDAIPRKTGLRGIAGNLGNILSGGSMTGFTPPINPYYNYNSYGNDNYGCNYGRNPFMGLGSGGYNTSGGYRSSNGCGYYDGTQNFSSGAGATILD